MSRDINNIISDVMSAQRVSDERKQELVDEVKAFFEKEDAFAAESIVYDAYEGDASKTTQVWNDDIRRTELENSKLGDVEVLMNRQTKDIFLGIGMSGLGSMMGDSSGKQYIHMTQDDISEFGISIPDIKGDKYYNYILENADVSVTGDTAIFHSNVDASDVEWLDPDYIREDVYTEGIEVIVAYDLDDERVSYAMESIRNAEEENHHVVKDYMYGVTFNFTVPDVEDENVMSMGDMGGLGGGMLGDIGDSDPFDGTDDMFGDDRGFF